jgi:hypothetical protein
VYFGLSADFDYPRQFSPPLPRIIESLLYFLSIAKNINIDQNDSISHKLDNNTPGHYLLQSFKTPFPNINLKSVSSKEVENVIKSLKTKNSSGYDEIPTKLLKISSSCISSPLTYIYN